MLIVKFIAVGTFVACWMLSRKEARHLKISDVFILMMLAIYLPYFFFNPQARSSWNDLSFSNEVIWRAEIGFLTVLAIGSLIFLAKFALPTRWKETTRLTVQPLNLSVLRLLSIVAILFSAFIFLILLNFQEFRGFREKTLEFATGQISGYLYSHYRSLVFSGTFLTDGVLGRLRFVVFPILFLASISWFVETRKYALAFLIGAAIFLALPMSFAKLPIAYFFGYSVFYLFYTRYGGLRFTYFATAIPAIVGLAVIGLSAIYQLQYNGAEGYSYIFGKPFELAHERVWGESYSILLRYFAVYPDLLSFTGTSGINLLAKIAGVEPRMPDIEVARTLLGPNSGSNPGVFFLGGYAAFGFAGLIVFSILGFGILFILDAISVALRFQYIRSIYMAIMSMNVLFFLQVSLQTALLTYGVLVIPLILLAIDRVLIRCANSR